MRLLQSFALVFFTACSHALKLDNLDPEETAVFGRLRVLQSEKLVTDLCMMTLSDTLGQKIKRVKPDEDGWIYTSVPSSVNDLYVGEVGCSLAQGGDTRDMAGAMAFGVVGMMSVSGGIPTFETRQLHFLIPSGRKMLYFGHITLRLGESASNTSVPPFVVPGGRATAHTGAKTKLRLNTKSPSIAHFDQIFDLEDGFSLALEDLNKRYGAQAKTVQPVNGAVGLIVRKK